MPTEPRFRRDRHPMCTCPTVPGPFGKRIDMQPDCPGGTVAHPPPLTAEQLDALLPDMRHAPTGRALCVRMEDRERDQR